MIQYVEQLRLDGVECWEFFVELLKLGLLQSSGGQRSKIDEVGVGHLTTWKHNVLE